jgi:hypothetical protein
VLVAVLVVSTLPGSSAHAGGPKPERRVSAKIVQVSDQGLEFKGKVFGSRERPYDNRVTRLQKKTCRDCNWQVVRTNRTDDRARYTYDVGAPRRGRWFFRAQVPETREYRTSYSRVWYTERT